MADGLPEGLVTNSSSIKGEIERVDRVAIEDVIQLWKGILGLPTSEPAEADRNVHSSLLYQQSDLGRWHGPEARESLLEDLEQSKHTGSH